MTDRFKNTLKGIDWKFRDGSFTDAEQLAIHDALTFATESEQLRKERDELARANEDLKKAHLGAVLKGQSLNKCCDNRDLIIFELQAKLDKAKDALRFYGCEQNYEYDQIKNRDNPDWEDEQIIPALDDNGQRARTTIEEIM